MSVAEPVLTPTFCPERLTLARQRRGLTKSQLAETCGLTLRSITGYEGASSSPSRDTLNRISRYLKVPISFFARPEPEFPSAEGVSFRALTAMRAGQRDAALGAGAIAFELHDWINAQFNLPATSVPDLPNMDPEAASEMVRTEWGLGQLSIGNTIHILEAHGVRVFSLTEDNAEVDAFSLWRGNVPFVFLNTRKSSERSRFDAAHELGHLVLHRKGGPVGRQAEHEANLFASAFLMPQTSILAHAPRQPSLPALVQAKAYWRVSVQALVVRLFRLHLLTEWHYRSLCVQIAEHSYNRNEPNSEPREISQVLDKVISMLRDRGVGVADIARDLDVYPDEVKSLIFGLVLTATRGGNVQRISQHEPARLALLK